MLSRIEKFIFEGFPKLPSWARVLAYFIILFVFVYLLLVPRFINGQTISRNPVSGGLIPYRGSQLQMYVDGRIYKYRANEEGYWSIPVVSLIPESTTLQIYHEDLHEWFKLEISPLQIWKSMRGEALEVEIAGGAPYVRLAGIGERDNGWGVAIASAVIHWLRPLIPDAAAGGLSVPGGEPLSAEARKRLEKEITSKVGGVLGKSPAEISDDTKLIGDGAPTFLQRVRLVAELEKAYGISIPDEHWRVIPTVRDMVDYVEARLTLKKTAPQQLTQEREPAWPAYEQSFPRGKRPQFVPTF